MLKTVSMLLLALALPACDAEAIDDAAEPVASTSAALSGSAIGVIPDKGQNCPGQRHEIEIWPEMSHNNDHREGWQGDWSTEPDAVIDMVYCEVPGAGFKPVRSSAASANYAVLKLGATCPAGSVDVMRYLDLEDDLSGDFTDADRAYPPTHHGGHAGMNLWLYLCVFKAEPGGSAAPFPDLGFRYGVMGSTGVPGDKASGYVYVDDEDDDNNDSWDNDEHIDTSSVIEGGDNTKIHLVRVR